MIIKDENGTHTLTLTDVKPEQSGEISCEARNAVGHKKQNANLTIRETGEAPTFVKNIEDRLVDEGEKLVMEAKLAQVSSNFKHSTPLAQTLFSHFQGLP